MNLLTRLTWGGLRLGIVLGALGVLAFGLARDRQAAHAVSPEILPNTSATNSNFNAASLILVKGGQISFGNTPCTSSTPNAKAACVRVWAKDVNNTGGASAFQVHFTYDPNVISVSGASAVPTWLSSTGRSAACPAPAFEPGDGLVNCATLSAPPPWGATGTGIIGTIAIESKSVVGPTVLNFSDNTYLVNTVANPDVTPPQQIPATVRSLNVFVAPCADFNGDGRVSIADILYVVQRYHTSDPAADLNESGLVLINDILIAVVEFNTVCTR